MCDVEPEYLNMMTIENMYKEFQSNAIYAMRGCMYVCCIVLALQVEAIQPVGLMIIVCRLATKYTVLLRSHLSHRFNP